MPTAPTIPSAGPAIADVVTEVFKYLDRNGDGVLSATELKVLQTAFHLSAASYKADLALVDSSGDGAVSKVELTSYLTKIDLNHDGHLSAAEVKALVPLVGHALAPPLTHI